VSRTPYAPRRTASAGAFPRSAASNPDSLRVLLAAAHTNPMLARRTQGFERGPQGRPIKPVVSLRFCSSTAQPPQAWLQATTNYLEKEVRAANQYSLRFCSLALPKRSARCWEKNKGPTPPRLIFRVVLGDSCKGVTYYTFGSLALPKCTISPPGDHHADPNQVGSNGQIQHGKRRAHKY